MRKKWIALICFAGPFLILPFALKSWTAGFKLAKLCIEIPYRSAWDVRTPLSETSAQKILSQPFRYLGKGRQCYAFESQDRAYVLKLFRFDRRILVPHKSKGRTESVDALFEGCRLAAIASEETGLLYLHLNESLGRLPVLNAKGPLRRHYRIPLDRCRFALQKKAIPLAEGLFNAKQEGSLEERLEEIVVLLRSRIEKGIGNQDPSLWRNFGFIERSAVEIDFGSFVPRPDFSDPSIAEKELSRYLEPLRSWLEKHAPESLHFLDAKGGVS